MGLVTPVDRGDLRRVTAGRQEGCGLCDSKSCVLPCPTGLGGAGRQGGGSLRLASDSSSGKKKKSSH